MTSHQQPSALRPEPPTTGTKHCPKCGETKHVLAFASHPDTHDRLQPSCRACWREYMHERYVATAKRPHSYAFPDRP